MRQGSARPLPSRSVHLRRLPQRRLLKATLSAFHLIGQSVSFITKEPNKRGSGNGTICRISISSHGFCQPLPDLSRVPQLARDRANHHPAQLNCANSLILSVPRLRFKKLAISSGEQSWPAVGCGMGSKSVEVLYFLFQGCNLIDGGRPDGPPSCGNYSTLRVDPLLSALESLN